ncbi:hypothetical protein BB427_20345 [Pseudoalteromonas sp. BMB]|uniref:hypothetical protein n=1 Tax=Pseudoalteromonas sp. BMB TaxID=1874619 RepID=UPI00083E1F24|nr:hypothetical protein [Pseudoalteromonas sp. BMB]ODB33958.1 hypothetical protein BB427_20345 [Pseudoalteromonas sp. BMB]
MNLQKELLQRVHQGELSFSPKDESLESLHEFQSIATRLISAYEQNYIQELMHSKSYIVAGGLVNAVIIQGGLTFEGEQFLQTEKESSQQTKGAEDMIDVKPNLFGVGINFNAVYKRLLKKN